MDKIREAIEKIKNEKRAQLREAQEDRTEDNVSADNSKIDAGKDKAKSEDGAEEITSKESLEQPEDNAGKGDTSSESAGDVDGSEHVGKPEASPANDGPDTTDAVGAEIVKETSDKINNFIKGEFLSEEELEEDQENRDTDNVSADNSKIDAGVDKAKSEDGAEEIPDQSAQEAKPENDFGANEAGSEEDLGKMQENFVTSEDFDISEDLQAIFGDGKGLSEDFKKKTKSIYEAAVVAKANQVIREALKIMKEDLSDYRVQIKESMETKVSDYLSLVVEEWAADNKQELVEQARYENNTSLIEGLTALLNEHNYEVPTDKVDLFDKVLEENIELEDKINQMLVEKVELVKAINNNRKEKILSENLDGLSENQKIKFNMLAEAVEFTSKVDYSRKLKDIKEAYFKPKAKKVSIDEQTEPVILTEEKTQAKDSILNLDEDTSLQVAEAISKTIR